VASPHILTGPILTVGLAAPTPGLAVGAVGLHHLLGLTMEGAGQAGAVAAGAFEPHGSRRPCRPSQPVAAGSREGWP
jgi:hypothetical protein